MIILLEGMDFQTGYIRTWSQVGEPLRGGNANGTENQGYAVSLSENSMIAVIGGPDNNSPNLFGQEATWVFQSHALYNPQLPQPLSNKFTRKLMYEIRFFEYFIF